MTDRPEFIEPPKRILEVRLDAVDHKMIDDAFRAAGIAVLKRHKADDPESKAWRPIMDQRGVVTMFRREEKGADATE